MLSFKKVIFLIGVGAVMTTSVFSAQPESFLNLKEAEGGDNKIFYKQQAIHLLKSQDLVEQKLGSDLLVIISTLPTSPDRFVQDITLLINCPKEIPYRLGVNAVVNYINQASQYHPEKYIWIDRFPPHPGQAAESWIRLLSDIAKDSPGIPEDILLIPAKPPVRKEAKLHIIDKLTHLEKHFATLNNEKLADKLNLSVEQIDALKAQRVLEALKIRNALLQTLDPSATNNGVK